MNLRTLVFCVLVSLVLMGLGAMVQPLPGGAASGWALLVLGGALSCASLAQGSPVLRSWWSQRSWVPATVPVQSANKRGY